MKILTPRLRVQLDGMRSTVRPDEFQLDTDMLTESDMLTVSYPVTSELRGQVGLDQGVKVWFDDRQVFTGRVADDTVQGGLLRIVARDNIDRLLEESVPGTGFRLNKTLATALARLAGPWFERIVFSNATDRNIRSGKARARVAGEPVVTRSALRALGQYVDAGEARWGGIQKLLQTFRLLAWSSGDGRDLVVSRPNYKQTTLYRLFRGRAGSSVVSSSWARSIAGRYSVVELSGTQTAPGVPAPPVFTPPGVQRKKRVQHSSRGRVVDTSGDFRSSKRLFINDSSIYPSDAQSTAERIFGQQQARASRIDVDVSGWGQGRAVYTFDRIASVTLSEPTSPRSNAEASILRAAPYYVTAVSYSARAESQSARLSLVPAGTVLV